MAPNNKKIKGKSNVGKGSKSKKGQQTRKTPTLKQKLHRESKVVKAESLNWKTVEVPDNLDDWEGFYGLEEIDGVDVKIVNGKAEFIVKDNKKVKKGKTEEQEELEDDEEQDEDEELEADEEQGEDEDEDEEHEEDKINEENEDEFEEEEFTGFDDDSEIQDGMEVEDILDEDINEIGEVDESVEPVQESKPEHDEELSENVFQHSQFVLPDDEDINLPHWQNEDSNFSLSPYTLHGLSVLGFDKPTPIQKKTIPLAAEGKDVVGKAITGSGKTLAYGIPILEKYLSNLSIINQNRQKKIINHPTGIIFAPTRELAHQVVSHLNSLAKYSPLSTNGIVSITGGLSIQKQERLLSHGPGIIVATPGRILELLQKDEDLTKRLASTDIIVLDEADRLLQDGHFEEFETILDLFRKNRPKNKTFPWKWQTLVFSATFSRDLFGKLDKNQKSHKRNSEGSSLIGNDEILNLLNDKLKFKDTRPALVDANPKEIVSGNITEALVECGPTCLLYTSSPLFIGESSPKHLRGTLVYCFQLCITLGIFIGYCVTYGTKRLSDSRQWRVPLGLCFLWAIFLVVGMLAMPESPRYLVEKKRIEDAKKSVARSNKLSPEDPSVYTEIQLIQAGIDREAIAGSASWTELITGKPAIFRRVVMGIIMQSLQQLTGVNYFFYYGTTIFQAVGLKDSFQTSIILGVVNFAATFIGIWAIERFGRRSCLLVGSAGMFVCFIIYSTIGSFHLYKDGEYNNDNTYKPSGNALIFITCLFIVFFASTWAGGVYTIISESYPLRIRSCLLYTSWCLHKK